MRCFAAFETGPAARAALGECIASLRPLGGQVSWVRPENLHLTLRFLGEVTPEQASAYAARLRVLVSAFPDLRTSDGPCVRSRAQQAAPLQEDSRCLRVCPGHGQVGAPLAAPSSCPAGQFHPVGEEHPFHDITHSPARSHGAPDPVPRLIRRLGALPPLELVAEGLGAFPSLRRPSVLWAGVRALSGDLLAVQRAAEACAAAIGLSPEPKPFHPHLTLGRVRAPRGLAPLLEAFAELAAAAPRFGDAFPAPAVALFQSELKPGGAVYTRLEEISLQWRSSS